MTPSLPDVRPGDPIRPAFEAVVRYERAEQLASGRNVRRRVMPNGTSYSTDEATSSWAHPWKVLFSGTEATVRAGLVNGITPTINRVKLTDAAQPKLKITGLPNAEEESWIALVVTVDPESGRIDAETDEPAKIIHTDDWQALENETTGAWPLALLLWKNKAVSSVVPNSTLNLAYNYRAANGTKPARHFFSGV